MYIDVYNEENELVGSIINNDMDSLVEPDYVPNLSSQTTKTQKHTKFKTAHNTTVALSMASM